MSAAAPRPHSTRPEPGLVRVGRVRASCADAITQARVADALRCAHWGGGQRLVLLRRVQVRTASVAGPGWSALVEQATQAAAAQARHGGAPGAAQADAVWFADWDEAVAAWLDAALDGHAAQAWFWPRIARLAGVAPEQGRGAAASPHQLHVPAAWPVAAMWQRWCADPASARARQRWWQQRAARGDARARSAWLAQLGDAGLPGADPAQGDASVAPAPADAASPVSTASRAGDATARAQTPRDHARKPALQPADGTPAVPHAAPVPHGAVGTPGAAPEHASPRDAAAALADSIARAAQPSEAGAEAAPALDAVEAASPQSASTPHTLGADVAASDAPALPATVPTVGAPAAPSRAGSIEPAPQPVPCWSAAGWTHLQRSALGGAPRVLNALLRLGYAQALQDWLRHAADERADAALAHATAASAPWLAAWAGLGAAARERCWRDPLFAALPVVELLSQAQPTGGRALDAAQLLAHWRAQPGPVRQLGRRAWRRLQCALREHGWRSPRELLAGRAWVQLSATHLDVVYALDQADASVRRLGLDLDPGWVPWLGRIVTLHYEPAHRLPPAQEAP